MVVRPCLLFFAGLCRETSVSSHYLASPHIQLGALRANVVFPTLIEISVEARMARPKILNGKLVVCLRAETLSALEAEARSEDSPASVLARRIIERELARRTEDQTAASAAA